MKIDEAQQVLKVNFALISSLTLNHIVPTLNCVLSTSLSQRESWGEALEWVWNVWRISNMTRSREIGIYILIPL